MFRKYFFKTFFTPQLCDKINIQKYPWGWKSKEEINKEFIAKRLAKEGSKKVDEKEKVLIKLENRDDLFEFERNLMVHNDEWQLCNINRIIV